MRKHSKVWGSCCLVDGDFSLGLEICNCVPLSLFCLPSTISYTVEKSTKICCFIFFTRSFSSLGAQKSEVSYNGLGIGFSMCLCFSHGSVLVMKIQSLLDIFLLPFGILWASFSSFSYHVTEFKPFNCDLLSLIASSL